MPRPCSICSRPERDLVDRALLTGGSYRDIARQFGTSHSAVHRHLAHVKRAVAAATDDNPADYGRTVLAQVRKLGDRAMRILDRAEEAGDLRAATGAIREARSCVELVGKLEGAVVERHAHLHATVPEAGPAAIAIDVSNAPAEVREAMEKLVRWEILQGGDAGVA